MFTCLKNPVFARLYWAQTINLVGDALTWVGLALLAVDLAGEHSGQVLSGALTLRVLAFVLLSPIAGVLADRVDRKALMFVTHLARLALVCCLPWVRQIWQLDAIVLGLNLFAAFFTPTYKATLPLVTASEEYPQAIALSSTTYQILGVLGPGIAGSLAGVIGGRSLFFLDGITFAIAAILIASLSGQIRVVQSQPRSTTPASIVRELKTGSLCLGYDPHLRYGLALQLVGAIAGAQILVNSIGEIHSRLHLGNLEYGWVMAALGIGASIASIGFGRMAQKYARLTLATIGVGLLLGALLPASVANLPGLMGLWLVAGMGQVWIDLPMQLLIADRVAVDLQGRVYGAQFAWSHLWWAIAYPLAGWLSLPMTAYHFFYSALVGLLVWTIATLLFKPTGDRHSLQMEQGFWHDHDHAHSHTDGGHLHHGHEHDHEHRPIDSTEFPRADRSSSRSTHQHLHFHPASPAEPTA